MHHPIYALHTERRATHPQVSRHKTLIGRLIDDFVSVLSGSPAEEELIAMVREHSTDFANGRHQLLKTRIGEGLARHR